MSKLFFVTGASGFCASHVVYQLLQDGHRVRATARGKKVAALRELYKEYPALEIVDVPDISHSQFLDALAGVDVVIHTATPLPSRVDPETMLRTAVEGSLNILRQAERAGVRKIVVTSTIGAVLNDPAIQGVSVRAEHWNPVGSVKITPETDGITAYYAAKTQSERAVWEWAAAHPHVDVTTINPTYIYGPAAPLSLRLEPGDFTTLSTSLYIYNLITPPGQHLPSFNFIDVRDTARAHIGAALKESSTSQVKRVPLATPDGLVESQLFDLIREKRPQVAERLVKGDNVVFPFDRLDLDFRAIEELTGMKKTDFHTTEHTFLDTIDSLLAMEKDWKAQGFAVKDIPLMKA